MNKHTIKVHCTCNWCKGHHSVTVYAEDYAKWQNGMTAQLAFPRLTATQREQIISGLCPKCQEYIFGGNKYDTEDLAYEF